MKKSLLTATIVTALLAGCSSAPPEPENQLAQRLIELQEAQRELELRQQALDQQKREEELSEVPDWVTEHPNPDGSGMYGVGIAKSKDLNHGLKASRLQAEFSVAAQYKQELSGSERAMSRGNSSGDVVTQETFLIDKLVDAVPVVGYQIVETKVVPIRGVYHVYTLLRLPYDEFNQVLISQKSSETDELMRKEFDDLERRLALRRAERERERQAEHERELEQMKVRASLLKDAHTTSTPVEEKQKSKQK